VIVPLMFAAAGVMFANSATAAEEDAGRLELFVAQPVSRRSVMFGRSLAVAAWIATLAAIVLASQLLSNVAFDLEIGIDRIVSTVMLCGLLGGFFAGLAIAVAGLVGRPGPVLAVGLGLAIVGYLVEALFPLSNILESWARLSPWEWALGGDPLVNDAEPWRFAALTLPALALVAVGVLAFDRRDLRSA
jgi:ABC-2 type transport system permease protein